MLFMAAADVLTWIQTIANGGVLLLQLIQMGSMIYLMQKISDGAWLFEQARKFCIEFDQILVKYAEKIYGYFTDIVGGTLLTPEIVDGLLSRVYVIVGLFIFFKLAMVAIKYMINPEQFTDDKLGAQTLVKRVIIGSILIILIPTIFDVANKLQASIINDRVIERVILPDDAYKKLIKSNTPGRDLSMLVFKGFFTWNNTIDSNSVKKVYNSYNKVMVYNDLTLFNKSLINEKKDDVYIINYVPIISTLAVGYLLFMLVKYAMEVAFRSFKLVFLQVLSPFVIVDYMLDPSKEEVMKKWVNSTIATYIMIFIRVITLWFATLICYYFTNGINGTTLLDSDDPLLRALIILALFAFLKDLPKLISEIFGYNLQENETIGGIMNQGVGILKGFALGKVARGVTKTATIAGMAGSALGAVGGVAGGGLSGMQDAKRLGLGKTMTGVSAVGGGIGASSSSIGSMSSMAGSIVSSSMGQTFLSPVTQTVSAASHSAPVDIRSKALPTEASQPKDKSKNSNQYVDVANNISNNQQFSQFRNGDNFNLQDLSILDDKGRPMTNPVVVNMANEVIERLSPDSLSGNSSTKIEYVSQQINQELASRNITSSCSASDMADVMATVTTKIESSVPKISSEPSSVSTSASTSVKEPTPTIILPDSFGGKPRSSNDDLESILTRKDGTQ